MSVIAQPPRSTRAARPNRASGRSGRRRRRPRLCGDRQCGAESGARPYRVRLRFLEQHRRLRYQPDADRLFVEHLDLRPRLLGRAAQYAAGRRHRHRARDRARLRRRHRAAVAQLAGRAACRRLRRAHPQRAAAAADSVLVQRRAQGAAGIARQHRAAGGGILNNRGLFLPRPEFAPGFGAVLDRACRSASRRRSRCMSGRAGASERTGERLHIALAGARL